MQEKFVILDCDPGIDDALALALLLTVPQLRLRAVTTSAGNQTAEKTFRNARNLLHAFGRADIPVYPGAARPLVREPEQAAWVHGEDGLGGCPLEESPAVGETQPAWVALARLLRQAEAPVTLLATGPLTNLALLLREDATAFRRMERILIMGGAHHGGNITPCAEFNFYCDPEAAQEVLHGGVPIVLFGLDVTERALLFDTDLVAMHAVPGKSAGLLARMLRAKGDKTRPFIPEQAGYRSGIPVHDACTAAYLLQPELFRLYPALAEVETKGEHTRGCSVIDLYAQETNIQMALGVKRKDFTDLIMRQLTRLP